ncbi:MAG TPA: CBS domain-containing protein [Planctomycetes bacterium]|nr:CBS domain-containing protein [Planctomycetota bacterium]
MISPDKSENGSFEDPLENYAPPVFEDPVEQALHEELVSTLQTQPHSCVSADTSVRDTMKLMVGRQIACVLVEEGERLVGVFGDRDVLDKVALEYDDVIDRPVCEVMSTRPVSVLDHDSAAKVLAIMAVSGYRHVPVTTPEGKTIGIVSPQRMAHFLMGHLQS